VAAAQVAPGIHPTSLDIARDRATSPDIERAAGFSCAIRVQPDPVGKGSREIELRRSSGSFDRASKIAQGLDRKLRLEVRG